MYLFFLYMETQHQDLAKTASFWPKKEVSGVKKVRKVSFRVLGSDCSHQETLCTLRHLLCNFMVLSSD